MVNMTLSSIPVASTALLIRRPAADVFEAFVDPAVTTRFWFTRSSGRLEAGKSVTWTWEMYGASTNVTVKHFEPHRRLGIEWDGYSGRTNVDWRFEALPEGTFVGVTESGFTGDGDALVRYVTDSSEGFSLTLAALKALLEHDIELNLVRDRFPKGPKKPYPD
jgi:uncharacterized protein YndB with AHSA1/START domain